MRGILLVAIVAAFSPAAAFSGSPARPWLDSGIEAYRRGLESEDRQLRVAEFARAWRAFARVARESVPTPALFVNLGNAALQAERLGDAILAYRRALWLDPDHRRARENLGFARTLLPEWVPRAEEGGFLDSFFFWHRTLARSERARLAAVCFALAMVAAALAIRTGQSVWRGAAVVPGLSWLLLIGSLQFDPLAREASRGVITASEAMARAADSALAPSLFPGPLPGGVEVEIVEARDPWLRVRLANGREAWVTASAVTRVWDDQWMSAPGR